MAPQGESRGVLRWVFCSAVGLSGGTNGTTWTQISDGGTNSSVCRGRAMMTGINRQQNCGQTTGLQLVKREPLVVASGELAEVREGSAGRLLVMLPRVWAVADADTGGATEVPSVRTERRPIPMSRPKTELAFYRKYTEGMLRRYMRMSMEAGRVPSLLGRELFRGNVTSYRVHSFEDVVVFCLDVERCLRKLNAHEQDLIKRVALQEYTQQEAAAVLGLNRRDVVREYGEALDKLTGMFLKAQMLEPLKCCQ